MLSDVDQFKHMSFANYLRLMSLAADALLLPCLTEIFLDANRLRVVKAKMQFKKQTLVGDNILIKVSSELDEKEKSFTLFYSFDDDANDSVAFGFQKFNVDSKELELPESLKDLLMQVVKEQRLNNDLSKESI